MPDTESGVVLGQDAKLYIAPASGGMVAWTGGLPAGMNVVDNVRDLTLNNEKGEADVSTRGTGGYRARKGTLKDGTVEFSMVWDVSDTRFGEIKDAFFNNTALVVAVLSSGDHNAEGLYALMDVMNFSRSEELEDAERVDVSMAITHVPSGFQQPSWVTRSST